VTGFGAGWVVPNISPWLISLAPEALRGRFVGGLTTSIFAGQFISPIILQPIIDAYSLSTALLITGAFLISIFVFIFIS
jgi:MFS family permease